MSNENFNTYIRFIGEFTFEEIPFNEVDAMIFSYLSYVDFSHIITDSMSLKQAYELLMIVEKDASHATPIQNDEYMVFVSPYNNTFHIDHYHRQTNPFIKEMLEEMCQSQRYKDIQLFDYRNELDNNPPTQFGAITIETSALTFLSFRGTDTMEGWKENFMMLYEEHTSSELKAVEYVNTHITHQFMKKKNYYIGGHSKGGHLALYASMYCDDKIVKDIKGIYNFDGPGFNKDWENYPHYFLLKEKMYSFTPTYSLIGKSLPFYKDLQIIESDEKRISQHMGYNWKVRGNHFVRSESYHEESEKVVENFTTWMNQIEDIDKETLIDRLIEIMNENSINSLDDFRSLNVSTVINTVKAMSSLSNKDRELISNMMKQLIDIVRK